MLLHFIELGSKLCADLLLKVSLAFEKLYVGSLGFFFTELSVGPVELELQILVVLLKNTHYKL